MSRIWGIFHSVLFVLFFYIFILSILVLHRGVSHCVWQASIFHKFFCTHFTFFQKKKLSSASWLFVDHWLSVPFSHHGLRLLAFSILPNKHLSAAVLEWGESLEEPVSMKWEWRVDTSANQGEDGRGGVPLHKRSSRRWHRTGLLMMPLHHVLYERLASFVERCFAHK